LLHALVTVLLGGALSEGFGCAASAEPNDPDALGAAPQAVAVTDHPRLWIKSADLPRLRSWATSQNPMYESGVLLALNQAVNTYNTKFFPNGQPNTTWPDTGLDSWVQYPTEAYAEFFAFMSLIDPDSSARPVHAARARNLLMYVMARAVLGADTSTPPAPFRSPKFATFDRANYWGEAFGLTVDWIYPYLTAQDKDTIRKVFLRWADECVHAATAGQEHPQPIGVVNSPELLSDKKQLRWAANNYFTGHMRHLALMSLSIDAADDPPVDALKPDTQLGNSVRSYIGNVTGAWLYQQYAIYEDPAIAAPALGVPAAGLGVASGGLSPEGFLYGASLGHLAEALLALHTAGYDDPTLSGPQAGLVQSAYWDRFVDGFLHSLTPESQVHSSFSYLGPLYQMASYGDLLHLWITPEFIAAFGALGTLDQDTGNDARLQKTRWLAENALEGGSQNLYRRASTIWSNGYASSGILYFLLFDPAAPKAADARPSLPTTFIDRATGRALGRTDWTPAASWFNYRCSWNTINHQLGDCNQFEFYRKGEWLTRERSGYAVDLVGCTSDYHNTIALENDTPGNLQWFEQETSTRGGQWTNGVSAGDPTVTMSTGSSYIFAQADGTNLYNRPALTAANSAMDIVHASRSVVWLKPDHIVVYDRATSQTANRFKRFNLTLLATPVISGRTAKVTSSSGQSLYLQSLLPANAVLSTSPAENFSTVADLEPTTSRLMIQDPSNPTDIRFLHVLQGADPGVGMDMGALLQEQAGTEYDGAVVRGTAVLFPASLGGPFTGLTYVVPANIATHVITGLVPGAGYSVTTQTAAGGLEVTVSAGGAISADSGGVLVATTGSAGFYLTPQSASYPVDGGSGSVTVSSLGDDAFSATSNDAWITVTAGASGSGGGTVAYTVDANPTESARTGTLTIGGQTVTITQAAPQTCTVTLSPVSASFVAAGGTGSVTVSAPAGCAWTAQSGASWITINGSGSGSGSGTVAYIVAANPSTDSRTGTLTIDGQTVTITQNGATPSCSYSLNAYSKSFTAAGGTQSVTISTAAGCSWTAVSNVSWISITGATSGSGSGSTQYSVAVNTRRKHARTGTLTIAGLTYTVTQGGAP
jgi:hypothetical protein